MKLELTAKLDEKHKYIVSQRSADYDSYCSK